jgi:uncharacterized protein YbcI
VLVDLSDAMVRIFKEQFGRGPSSARCWWAGPDMVVCVLEDTLTPAEAALARLGEHARLRDTRMSLQHATVPQFCAPVERLTGRKVRAFHSSIDTQQGGQAVEAFLLHPEGYEGPSRGEVGPEP